MEKLFQWEKTENGGLILKEGYQPSRAMAFDGYQASKTGQSRQQASFPKPKSGIVPPPSTKKQ